MFDIIQLSWAKVRSVFKAAIRETRKQALIQ